MAIEGQIRIIAGSREDAEELAGYINRVTAGIVWFHRPRPGRKGEWIAYGEIELPPGEDTRAKNGSGAAGAI